MASSSMKKVTLKTSDGEIFEVDEVFVNESQKIKAHLISDRKFTDDAIPLPNISSETLSMVIEYVKKHTESGSDDKSLKAWDAEFIMKGDINKLYNLITAANDLGNKRLLDLACLTTADIIKGKNPEQIRQIFNIECDFTPQEEEEHRRMFPTFY